MRDEQGVRRGFTMRRFAFVVGLIGTVYYIYKGDQVGMLCFGGVAAIALISKGISFVKKARRAGK
jgi:hypothetical protein